MADRDDVLVRLREICLALPETSERLSHGAPSFFIQEKKCFVMVLDDHHGDGRFALWCAAPPGDQQLLDVPALIVRERHRVDEAPRLRRVVVLDRGLEVLAHRDRLRELAAQPAEEAHLCCFDCHMGGAGFEPATPCV